MVALAVMAIVVTIAFSGLAAGINSWERGSRAIDQLDRRNTMERLLKRQLALANPLRFEDEDPASVLFRGTNYRLEFISDYSLADGPGDLRKIDYAIDGGRFFYGEKTLFDYVPSENEAPPTDMLAAFRAVSFRYLTRDENGNAVWVDEWKTGMGLPPAIHVRIDDDSIVVLLVNR